MLKAKEFQQDGKRWVVDMDLAKFFDEVDHDILMTRVKRKVRDRMVLKLIGAYLKAGVMKDGTLQARKKGTPQGGNLSPLLANILLDELDKQLEERGHTFCRYADDCNIYVRSEKSGTEGDGLGDQVCGTTVEVESEPREKCCGQAMGEEVPGVHRDTGTECETEGRL